MDTLNVMVVDELPMVRNYIKNGLTKSNSTMRVVEAKNGHDAVSKLESDPYDLIVSGWEMPGMDGAELVKWIRCHGTLKDTKFIMVSGRSDRESVLKAHQFGVSGYLLKPFTIESLLTKMADIDCRFSPRKHERISVDDSIVMHYGDQSTRGKLLDISLGGMHATFPIKKGFPQLLDKTLMDVGYIGTQQIVGISGFVIRMQAASDVPEPTYINIACKFLEKDLGKLADLKAFVSESMQNCM